MTLAFQTPKMLDHIDDVALMKPSTSRSAFLGELLQQETIQVSGERVLPYRRICGIVLRASEVAEK